MIQAPTQNILLLPEPDKLQTTETLIKNLDDDIKKQRNGQKEICDKIGGMFYSS